MRCRPASFKVVVGVCVWAFFLFKGLAAGITLTVSTTGDFRSALNQAQANGEDDVIHLAAGTYMVSDVLFYTSSENNSLDIVGAGMERCILDGGGVTQLLSITTIHEDADVSISNLTVQNGSTTQNGGALSVEVQGADITLQNCHIQDSETTGEESVGGGAVCSSETGTVIIQSCGFYRNHSESNVGGLYLSTYSGTGRIIGSIFEGNSVNNVGGWDYFGDGGGAMLYSGGASHAYISNNTFTNNTASGGSNPDGGGLMTYQLGAGSSLVLDKNVFQGNTAGLGGGGCILRFNNTDNVIRVTENTFSNNVTTTGSGAGVFLYINDATLTYSGNTHINNIAQGAIEGRGAGAEINHKNGEGLITGNTFTSNQAGNNGGGLSIPCETATMTITRNVFNANKAGNVGGGLSYSTVSGSLTLTRNTWYGNQATSEGGGIYVYFEQDAGQNRIKNNILWNNTPTAMGASSATGQASLSVTYSDVEDGTGQDWFGTGCIASDPLFTDPENGDFHLSWANTPVEDETKSPCIHAGDPTSPLDPDGSRADMGAKSYGLCPDIKANGADGPITVSLSNKVSIRVSLDPGQRGGDTADWWIAVYTPFAPPNNWYSCVYPANWSPGIAPFSQSELTQQNVVEVLNMVLPRGSYTFYFAIDDPDGAPNGPWWAMDSVKVTVK